MKICVILSDFHWCNKYFDSPASKVIDLIFQPFCITDNTVEDISSCEPSFHLQNIFIQCKNCVMIFLLSHLFFYSKSVISLFACFSSASKLSISFVVHHSDLPGTCWNWANSPLQPLSLLAYILYSLLPGWLIFFLFGVSLHFYSQSKRNSNNQTKQMKTYLNAKNTLRVTWPPLLQSIVQTYRTFGRTAFFSLK